ncbi:MAG: radical SAM protein [bacterium]
MKILLLVSPFKSLNPKTYKTELLGVLYLGANLRKHGHEVIIYDLTLESPIKKENGLFLYSVPEDVIKNKIMSFKPDVLGVSCHYASSKQEAYDIFSLTKRIDPDIVTVIGGLFVSVYKTKSVSGCDAIDYGLIGESENSLIDLLSYISSKSPALNSIDGLIYRDGNKIMENSKKNFIKDLDSLPFPARDMVPIEKYMNNNLRLYGLGNRPSLSLLTSRSCPNLCSFCNMWMVHGVGWRFRSVENILAEIDGMVNKYKAEHIYIMDDNFLLRGDRVKQLCEEIIRRKYNIRWNTPNGISVRGIDIELVRLMKRSGCASVCLAIESGSEYIRNTVMKKNTSTDQIIRAVQCFHQEQIPVGGFLILGMPGENEKYFKETVNFINRLPLSFIIASYAIPYPGTKLYSDLINMKIIEDGFQPEIDLLSRPVFETKDFTRSDLIRRKKKLLMSFYLKNIPQIMRELIGGRLYWLTKDDVRRFIHNSLNL